MATQRVAVYIDGFNLYYGMHDRFGRRFLWLDLGALGQSFLAGGQVLVKVMYFTARVRNDPLAQANQGTYLSALRATGTCAVIEGRFQSKRRTCKRCLSSFTSYEEKETDVSLAAALVEDAANGVYDKAVIVTGDSDLAPAVRAVRRLRPSARIVAAFPPNRQSEDLKSQVHGCFSVGRDKLAAAQMPDPVVDERGTTYVRPPHWA